MAVENAFLKLVLDRAKNNVKRIVLPEGDEERNVAAAVEAARLKIAKITLLGDEAKIKSSLTKLGATLSDFTIIEPLKSELYQKFSQEYYELRKNKGLTIEQAQKQMEHPIYFGTMMIKAGLVDGLVAGAIHSTADTVRPALQIIKAAKGIKTVSSMFFMAKGEATYLYADCGVVEQPNAEELSDIALATAITAKQFGFDPRVAMLSYSTKGSAKSADTQKVADATKRTQEKIKARFGDGVPVDGELQFDAAYVPKVAASKCPDSPLKGNANVFVFPDLDAGNLAYKITQRLGDFEAYGPILQGLARPMNDLSRGCSSDDIVATVAITAIQAQGCQA
ncbi:MAG: phosphate acetyltransferase [Sedimentisphaerales bacterium]|nr:phosphate acetyltransferase [Sedimentisphaerales bacterium]